MPHPSRWSLQVILGILIGGIGMLLIFQSFNALIDANGRYAGSRRVATLSAVSKPLLTSMIAARLERGTLANGLIAEKPLDDASLAVIAGARLEADAAYDQAMHALAQADVPGLAAVTTTLRSAHDNAAALRQRADAAVRQARGARDAGIVSDEPPVFQRWVDATLAASEFVEAAMMLTDPVTDQLLSVKRSAWAMRGNAGLMMSRSEGAVSSRKPWTATEVMTTAEERGRILQAWGAVSAAGARADALPEIADAVARAERDYLGYLNGEQKGYFATLAGGQIPDIAFSELQRRDTVAAVAVANVAKTALSVMLDHADAEMRRSTHQLVLHGMLMLVACCMVVGGLAVIRRHISRPLQVMTEAMRRLADGDLSVQVPYVGRGDEIGAMALAVGVFHTSMQNSDRLSREQRTAQEKAAQRSAQIESLNQDFDRSVSSALHRLGSAATQLTATATGMTANTEAAGRQATVVASASGQASDHVQAVAAATDELSHSIQEISRQIAQSTTIAEKAVGEAADTNATMRTLSEAAQKIGDVVRLISDIASRTNLLALNATIEAARAGDAGKGFAVVASEVKSLAGQTARATEEITAQVSSMQVSTAEAAAAIARIDGTIGQMNEIAASIAAAVEQQNAATGQIAGSVKDTAQRTAQVSSNIDGLRRAVGKTGEAAVQVLGAADELGQQSETLRGDVGRFLAAIRVA